MERPHLRLPPWAKSLSARLLVLTVGFVMLAEIFVFAPSVARFRVDWLKAHLDSGYLAALALEATPDQMISDDLTKELLSNAGVHAVVLRGDGRKLLLQLDDMPTRIDRDIDLTVFSIPVALHDAFDSLIQTDNRMLRVVGMPSMAPNFEIEILIREAPMVRAMRDFGWRVMGLSLVISFFTAGLVYFALNYLLVRPMRQFTRDMIRFRSNPQDPGNVIIPDDRDDEIGVARHELAQMQHDIQAMLNQRRRLAALGSAAAKVSHDLRNALATSMLMTEKLANSADEEVRAVVPRLLSSMERAIYISEQTLSYAREAPPSLDISRFTLRELFEECREQILDVVHANRIVTTDHEQDPCTAHIDLDIADNLVIEADYDQLFRVFGNLVRNALEAGAKTIRIAARPVEASPETASGPSSAMIDITIADDGPGLPEKAIKNLFVPFAGSARKGGTGLGLAIARELINAHGGNLRLKSSGPDGTAFAIRLPVITSPGNQ
ncbi:HAMP domain-containing sensor histidine kinase [Thalassospira sp.]|uniref:sensor histidine kinase n=1 Tax=Thalassospira sp. TaxID=1912094 RepID=UPI0027334701|nr:HAMP domain-containing sensor histidine kinase [Thalassospira sp.]MDP2700216.1 HAMP domain-containing sensor histidine kinase [Thalassospira sp.]